MKFLAFLVSILLVSCSTKNNEKLVGVWGYEENGERLVEIAIFEKHAVAYLKDDYGVKSINGMWKNDTVFETNPFAGVGSFTIKDGEKLYNPFFHTQYMQKFDGQIKTLQEN